MIPLHILVRDLLRYLTITQKNTHDRVKTVSTCILGFPMTHTRNSDTHRNFGSPSLPSSSNHHSNFYQAGKSSEPLPNHPIPHLQEYPSTTQPFKPQHPRLITTYPHPLIRRQLHQIQQISSCSPMRTSESLREKSTWP